MRRQSLFFRIFWSMTALSAVMIVLVAWLVGRATVGRSSQQAETDLLHVAQMTAATLVDTLADRVTLARIGERSAQMTGMRLTVIAPDGKVLSDSEHPDKDAMQNHADRLEVAAVLRGEPFGVREGFSTSLRAHMMYVAVPVRSESGRLLGVCRIARPLSVITAEQRAMAERLFLIGTVAVLLCMVLSWLLSRSIVRPLTDLAQVVTRIGAGDLTARIGFPDTEELFLLAEQFNHMANELRTRITELTRDRAQINAILEGMTDGVMVVDHQADILLCNVPCRVLLSLGDAVCVGHSVQEAVRHPVLNQIVGQLLVDGRAAERDMLLTPREVEGEERHVLVRAVALTDRYPDAPKGVLLVFTDVSRLKRLENLRRDFAANVSHELRTPVTSILGFVETLLDGAIDDPENARRFLKIIHAHTYRLGALIKDLMALTKIERDQECGVQTLESVPVLPFLLQVDEAWRGKAEAKAVRLAVNCPEKLCARLDSGLFIQAVGNLVDNAIVYSPDGGTVEIDASAVKDEIQVRVRDQGRGIPPEHLPRIFERFYTVDRARSRANGGTGLGLAIVKHVMQVHGGRVTVESQPESGSVFTLHFPA